MRVASVRTRPHVARKAKGRCVHVTRTANRIHMLSLKGRGEWKQLSLDGLSKDPIVNIMVNFSIFNIVVRFGRRRVSPVFFSSQINFLTTLLQKTAFQLIIISVVDKKVLSAYSFLQF